MALSPRQLGEHLRARRLERQRSDPDLTLVALCEAVGLSTCDLLALERGVELKLSAKTRRLLAEHLQIDPDLLPEPAAQAPQAEETLPTTHQTFGAYIKARREELRQTDRRYSMRQVAERIGLPPAYLSNIESDIKNPPNEESICALAEALDDDPDVLLALAGKLAGDVRGIILKRPKLFTQLIRELAHKSEEEIHLALQAFDDPKQRARALAEETLAILNAGHYQNPLRQQVEIRRALEQAVQRTTTHAPDEFARRPRKKTRNRRQTRIEIHQAPTLKVMQALADGRRSLVVLNFADAFEPGGSFRRGGRAQEQTLVGASGLLSCLEQGTKFYEQHLDRDPFHSDALIYAPAVPVFRDAEGALLEQPYPCAFISASAVNARAIEQRSPQRRDEITERMAQRMQKVLSCAQAYDHHHLILGAWGCGTFGNSPTLVARLFFDALQRDFEGVFRSVVFAIQDERTAEIFREQFKGAEQSSIPAPMAVPMMMSRELSPSLDVGDHRHGPAHEDSSDVLTSAQRREEPVSAKAEAPDAQFLEQARERYRQLRIEVFDEATCPDGESKHSDAHRANQARFREQVLSICTLANLDQYRSPTPEARTQLWHHLWTKTRYSGIRSQIATDEIADLKDLFDDYRWFSDACWNLKNKGHTMIEEGTGSCAKDFIGRTGPFAGKLTVANLPKLQKLITVARAFKHYFELYPDQTALSFITGDLPSDQTAIWEILKRLDHLGYRGDLTSLHLLMDLGFPVIKPDIVLSRLFLQFRWLHAALPSLPKDVEEADLRGAGGYKTSFIYTKPIIYQAIVAFANQLVAGLDAADLERDIGWVSSNPLREFDLFMAKAGQRPEREFGIERTLYST
ncbi:TIGR02452 family protein [Lamprobacter modestohalophilus]|uniref:TIGR02452 family protein n=1 Tax=Lamprobacter modestohalophilus TaxID=1064514 RepID=A0A9X0WBZ2_9GAMM|nr:TIGR02452 family protein [Lamprobacter modestohalophilus]MBK1620753.1 TIGR02452 family protein [Lamprobacter modestohalophilus]